MRTDYELKQMNISSQGIVVKLANKQLSDDLNSNESGKQR